MRQEVSFTTFIAFITEEGEKKDEDTFVYALLKKEWESKVSLYACRLLAAGLDYRYR